MNIEEIISKIKSNKKNLFEKYSLKNLAVFGSFSRGENTLDSDIDILAEFARPTGIEIIDLADELESILLLKVDIVSYDGIKPRYFKHIKEDLIYV